MGGRGRSYAVAEKITNYLLKKCLLTFQKGSEGISFICYACTKVGRNTLGIPSSSKNFKQKADTDTTG